MEPVAEERAELGEIEITTSEHIVFSEYNEASRCIVLLGDGDLKVANQALSRLRKIFDKYLELPSLLDRHVQPMVCDLASSACGVIGQEMTQDEFWTCPLPRILSALYALSKVRGRKQVQKFLPHKVKELQPLMESLKMVVGLQHQAREESAMRATSDAGPALWESSYTLWNWMEVLSLVPFDCSVVVDSQLISSLLKLGRDHLSEAGPTRDIAASCLASWISRQDMEKTELRSFIDWSVTVLQEFNSYQGRNLFQTMGVLRVMVSILKGSKAPRPSILELTTPLHATLHEISEKRPSNVILRKLLAKWWTRLGTTYLPPRVVAWRYQRGRRFLKENLVPRTVATSHRVEQADDTDKSKYFFQIPDEVEGIMGHVLASLGDPSTVVRWSAAKGAGRIAARLPELCAEDVLDALMGMFDDRERDDKWHGACLALAELARRGLLLESRLPGVVHNVSAAMHYDIPRRQSSVGANVRDAACYTFWAIARTYSASVLRPFVHELSTSVVLAFLFDREVNCRRAASAAFQEFVGRQGATNFEHGIDILTKADYFSLGNRVDAFTSIALHIARIPGYSRPLVVHLYQEKLSHWDPVMRQLAAVSLRALTPLERDYIACSLVPSLVGASLDPRDVQRRHGAVLGLAEILGGFHSIATPSVGIENIVSRAHLSDIVQLVPTIEKKRLYRGRGGEQMRAAVCRFIECLATARVPLLVPQQVRLLDSIDACLPHPNECVSKQAGKALYSLTRNYFPVTSKGPSDRLQKRIVDKYVKEARTSVNPAATRGFTLALGNLPPKLAAPSSQVLDLCITCLCRCARPDATVGKDKDAETRRNAIVSLTRLCESVGIEPDPSVNECIVGLTQGQIDQVFAAMFCGMGDYNVERRGDVGAMVRIVAMHGLEKLVILCASASDELLKPKTAQEVVSGVVKQLAEKLDAVRSEAGAVLHRILTSDSPPVLGIPQKKRLQAALSRGGNFDSRTHNWADASVTFPIIAEVLSLEEYFDFVLSGLVVSVGCMTQGVSKQASMALVQWTKCAPECDIMKLGGALLHVFTTHLGEGRVVLPLLKTFSLLLDRGCIDLMVNNPDFTNELLSLLEKEESRCRDMHRLTAITHASLSLLNATPSTQRQDPLRFVCKLLQHPYPRIRRLAAESLYVHLLDDNQVSEAALGLLLNSPWGGDETKERVRSMAADVVRALDTKDCCDSKDEGAGAVLGDDPLPR